MAAHSTKVIYLGMGLNLTATALLILLGALLKAPGAQAAVVAFTAAFILEILFLRKAGRTALA